MTQIEINLRLMTTAVEMVDNLVNCRYPFLEELFYDSESEKWKVVYESGDYEDSQTEFDSFSDMIDYLDELNDH